MAVSNGVNPIFSGIITSAAGTGIVAGGAEVLDLGTSGMPNIYVGSGLPTMTAPRGSLYLRTDGSSTTTRLYVNTTGLAVWTNFTSAA